MRNIKQFIKQHAADMAGLLVILLAFFYYSSSSVSGGIKISSVQKLQEYTSTENAVYELNASANPEHISAVFPAKKQPAIVRVRPRPQSAPGKPVRNSSYISYVSSSVLDNGKTVYMFVDNTVRRIYTLAMGESNGGLTLKEVANGYFLIETPESIERVDAPR